MRVPFPYIPLRNPSGCRLRLGRRVYPTGNHRQSRRDLQGICDLDQCRTGFANRTDQSGPLKMTYSQCLETFGGGSGEFQ